MKPRLTERKKRLTILVPEVTVTHYWRADWVRLCSGKGLGEWGITRTVWKGGQRAERESFQQEEIFGRSRHKLFGSIVLLQS